MDALALGSSGRISRVPLLEGVIAGWRTAQIHAAILQAFGLTPATYALTQQPMLRFRHSSIWWLHEKL